MAKRPRHVSKLTPQPLLRPGTSLTSPPDCTKRTWRKALCPALVVLLALLAYAPTLWNGLAFDDTVIIGENQQIKSIRNFPRIFITDYWGGIERPDLFAATRLFRPLVIATFALNYAVGGLKPIGYHAVNILLHAGVSLAVYGLGVRWFLSPAGATLAAALFAVHPLHTEAVAGIVGRAEILMALGVLLAIGGYIRGGALTRVIGAPAAFALGLLGKEQAVMLPALLVLYDAYEGSQRLCSVGWTGLAWNALRRIWPYAGILAAYMVLRAWVLHGAVLPFMLPLDNPLAYVPVGVRLHNAVAVAGRYLLLFLWPSPLSPDYSYDQIPLLTSPINRYFLTAALLWGSLAFLAVQSFVRARGAAGFSIALTTLMFFPASNLIVPIGTIMGERLFYLPSVGLCWLVGLGWQHVMDRTAERHFLQRSGWAILGALLLVFTAMTVRYGRVWRDDDALFSYAIQVAPRSAKIQLDFGSVLAATPDRKEEAIQHFRQAVEIYNAYGKAWDAMGRAYLQLKRWDQAIAAFKEASALDPADPNPYNNVGVAYANLARWDDAMAAFRQAVALKPDLVQAHRNLADLYDKKGWSEAALAQRALELTPTDPVAWTQAGNTFLRLRWPEQALGTFREAVRLDPNLPEARLGLAQAYESLDRFPEAAQAYEALLSLRPHAPAIHRHLADLYSTRLRDPARAEAHHRQAQEAPPRPAGP